jgi:shikimate kinase
MGVGKTTIGKVLAESLGLEFVDSDREIERVTGADIPGFSMLRVKKASVLESLR